MVTGIICEYNPLHLGHKKQLDTLRALHGPEARIVCLMSGNYVQRGEPALLDKAVRAKAAVLCGADLVLELPLTVALSSAEGFAAGGVSILSQLCTHLCFGAETPDRNALLQTAQVLLSPAFSRALPEHLAKGISFPAARQAALESLGYDGSILQKPNNILAVEYCKAIIAQNSPLLPLPIYREGDYHESAPLPQAPSATAVRMQIESGGDWRTYVPDAAISCFEGACVHTVAAGERAILGTLRCMTESQFQALPYGSEGLWRKLMHTARKSATLAQIIDATKSKRYTRTRIQRMLLCAFLGITAQDLSVPAPYVRVLAFNDRGRQLLRQARNLGDFPNIGQQMEHPYQMLENRSGDLYGLFARDVPDAPGAEAAQRVFYTP